MQNRAKRFTNSIPFLSLPYFWTLLSNCMHACMDENMDAICLSSSAAATPLQFVLLLLPGYLMLEE